MSETPHVFTAICNVQADMARDGIAKDKKNQQQGYSFRGIDDVYNALSPMLAKHKLCILPRMINRIHEERASKNGGTLFYVTVEAEFDFVSAVDGSKAIIRTFGEAMDSGDKATNKAMSAAYKYAAFQTFAIPTEGDHDADATTHEPKYVQPPSQTKNKPLADAVVEVVTAMCFDKKDITDAVKFRYNRPKFADLGEEQQTALLADFRDCEKYFRKLMSVIEARDVAPGDEARDTTLMSGALEYLKKRGDGFPLRFASSQWLKWVEELETEVFKEVER